MKIPFLKTLFLSLAILLVPPAHSGEVSRTVIGNFNGSIIDKYISHEERYCSKTAAGAGGVIGAAGAGTMGGMMFGPIGAAIGGIGGAAFGLVSGWDSSCETTILLVKREDGTMFELLNPKDSIRFDKGARVNITLRDDGSSRISIIPK